MNYNELSDDALVVQNSLAETWIKLCCENGYGSKNVKVCAYVEDAVQMCAAEGGRCLVSGSLHLVGSALTVLGASAE